MAGKQGFNMLAKDISNEIYYNIKILYRVEKKQNKWYYYCLCHCGQKFIAKGSNITSNRIKSCGCLKNKSKDFTNFKFGLWTVIKNLDKNKWLCRCNCGTEKIKTKKSLRSGTNCGCLQRKILSERMKKIKGKNHPNYNPNITDQERKNKRRNYHLEYSGFSKRVFERDNYTCQICGKYGGILNAHHLDGYSWCEEKRCDISNGITLCGGKNSCHNKFHKLYGKKYNTKEQFIEFKENECQLHK